jgi:two-component system, NtrC family, response regulator AtoC
LSIDSPTKDKRPLEVRILVCGRDPGLPLWVRKGLDGIAYRAEFMEALPESSGGSTEPDFRPDLALIDEEASSEFPARLRRFKETYPQCQLLLLGREESTLTPRAIRPIAVRHWFYRPFPPQELERILGAAGRSLQRQWREEHRHTRSLSGFEGLVGSHPKLIEALEMARRVAASPRTTVLILGETGTGKGLLAKAIHTESPRNGGPFIEVNCGAMPPNLMESELFGHVKGAFTSAVSDKPGLLELADGGSVFLDEVGELDLALQAKILKFLDDGQIRRVQGTETIQVDARMITATNRNLESEVAEKRFRLDLIHRLNVVTISLPPLRERSEDIPRLARHYLAELSARIRGHALEWTDDALEVLQRYDWPGNVRELINLTERMVLIGSQDERISAQDLPSELSATKAVVAMPPSGGPPIVEFPAGGVAFRDVERAVLEAALSRTHGNVTEAARLLRMSRGSLRYRLEKLGLREKASRRRGRPMKRRSRAA